MATRQDRIAARQRGAGTHKVQDVGFSISLPSAGQSASNAPPNLAPQISSRSARSTPRPQGQTLPPSRSIRRTPSRNLAPAGPTAPLNTLAKGSARRLYDPQSGELREERKEASEQSAVKRRKAADGKAVAVTVTPAQRDTTSTTSVRVKGAVFDDSGPGGTRSSLSVTEPAAPSIAKAKGRAGPAIASITPIARGKRMRQPSPDKFLTPVARDASSRQSGSTQSEQSSSGIPDAEIAERRSSGAQAPRTTSPTDAQSEELIAQDDGDDTVDDTDQNLEEDSSEELDQYVSKRPPRQSASRIQSSSQRLNGKHPQSQQLAPRRRSQRLSNQSQSTLASPPSKPQTLPRSAARTRKTIKPQSITKKIRKKTVTKSRKGTRAAPSTEEIEEEEVEPSTRLVPILVYRFSKPRTGDDDSASSLFANLPSRNQPNAVDVLAQVCREVIENQIKTLAERSTSSQQQEELGSRTADRSKMKRQKQTLTRFAAALDIKLLRMSEALDAKLLLAARVKKALKRQQSLQMEIARRREEREAVELKIDGVRDRHEQAVEEGRVWERLNEGFERVEGVVERRELEPVGAEGENDEGGGLDGQALEVRIRKVLGDVSQAEGGGVLERIKGFNGFLERALLQL